MTYKQYEDLVYEFVSQRDAEVARKYLLSTRGKLYCENNKVTPAEMEDPDEFNDYIVYVVKNKKKRSVEYYTKSFREFYDFLFEKGVVGPINPAMDARNSVDSILPLATETMPFYHPYDLKRLFSMDEHVNNALYKSLVYSFYEGVAATAVELHNLKTSDVNYGNRTIKMARGIIPISDQLAASYSEIVTMSGIKDYSERYETGTGVRTTPFRRENPDDLIPSTTKYFSQFCYTRLRLFSRLVRERVSADILYHDGFIMHVIDEMGEERFSEFMKRQRSEKRDVDLLKDLRTQYKYVIPEEKMRRVFKPYVTSLLI